ncbi:isochorismatase family protein, partial [Francisella tularensis subsp. holarctica]
RELHDRDFKDTVIADACNASSQQAHEARLTNLRRIADIVDIDDFI